jgi:hypothetical protein
MAISDVLKQLKEEKRKIEAAIAALESLDSSPAAVPARKAPAKAAARAPKRQLSAAARRKISQAAKARWARVKAAQK